MGMKLQTAPNYIKKKELDENSYAFERLMYVGSTENKNSKYPGTPGAINHRFEDDGGTAFVISGDTVMNRIIEDDLVEGMHCGLFYLGKKDNNGEDVNYHNWQIALDEDEKKAVRDAKLQKSIEPQQTSMNLDDLE